MNSHAAPGKEKPFDTYQLVAYWTLNDQLVSNGAYNDIVEMYLLDVTTGTKVPNASLNIQLQGASGSTLVSTGPTGVLDYPVNNMLAGPMTVTIKYIGPPTLSQIVNINFIAGPPSINQPTNPSYFITTANNAPADGNSQNVVQVFLADQNGNKVTNYPVTFTITSGGQASTNATFLPPAPQLPTTTAVTVNTDGNGFINLPLTDFKSGNVTITATFIVGGITYTIPVDQTVTFTAGPPAINQPTNPSYFITTTNNQTADGHSQDVVQVFLADGSGTPVGPGVNVTFTITSSNAASTNALFDPPPPNLPTPTPTTVTVPTTGNTGIINLPLTDLKSGNVTITATFTVGGITYTIPSDQTVTFVAGPPAINQPSNPSFFITTTNNQAADGHSQDVVQVFLADQNGNKVTNYPVTFTITSSGKASTNALFDPPPPNPPTPTPTTVTVNTDGNGFINLPLTDIKTGKVTITATFIVAGITYTVPVDQTVTFVAGPPVPSNPSNPTPPAGGGPSGGSGPGPSNPSDPAGPGAGFTYLTMTYNNVPSDGVSTDTATVFLTDANQNVVANYPVIFTFHIGGPANGGALFQPQNEIKDTVYTNSNGYASIPITDTLAGDAWVDAWIQTGGFVAGSSAIAHFTETPDVNNPETQLIVVVYEAIADGTSTTVVKAHVVDKSGAIMVGQEVKFAIDSGTATIITPQPWLTDGNGDAFISLTSTKTGFVLITATVDGKAIKFLSPIARVKFVPINIYVPKVFTPNNDGTNDVLKPILVGIATFHYFNVYNRWGNLVFSTQDPTRGWDGTFKGVAQPVETYLWIAEGIDINGKKIVQKGMTSLVR